jgi:hypothetical protein
MSFKKSKNRGVVEISIFIVLAFVIVFLFDLRTESLLFVALIFGIYLLVSGRVRQLKFMEFEIVVTEVESKQLELEREESMQAELHSEYFEKGGPEKLEIDVKPRLIREAKKIRVLRITQKKEAHYDVRIAYAYLQYFTHVIFIDENNLLTGFVEAKYLLNIIKPTNPLAPLEQLQFDNTAMEFVKKINDWKLDLSVINPKGKDINVVKGASRKQVLDLMNQHKLWVLPVVSSGPRYEGVIDYDSIIWQITSDLYKHAKISFPKK